MNTLSLAASQSQDTAPAPPPAPRRIILTGFMGAGKSTVGRLLADRLHWNFLDLDHHLETRAGATVPQLFERHGEAHFRRLESSALSNALSQASLVLALGGGAPETLTNRLLLEQTPGNLTVFLDAPFATLFDRCMLQALNPGAARDADRPNLRDAEAARARFLARQPLYRRIASLSIDTTSLSPVQAADRIFENLSR